MANAILGYQLSQQGVNLSSANALTPKAAVQAKTKNIPKILRYPIKQLDSSTDYFEIKVVEYTAPGFKQRNANDFRIASGTEILKKNIENSKTWIHLPMPKGISDSNSVTWGDQSINALQAYGANAISNTLGSGNMAAGIVNAFQKVPGDASAVSTAGGQDIVQSYFTSELIKNFGSNLSTNDVLARTTGQILNPNMELLFQGVNLRNFSFTFDFAPREPAESEMIKNIIFTLKKSMAAKTTNRNGQLSGAGLFISSPDVFQLTFKTGNKEHPFLYKMKPCALTNIQMNYAASGSYATYDDATPVHMEMTLEFHELNPVYAEDYNKDVGGVGY